MKIGIVMLFLVSCLASAQEGQAPLSAEFNKPARFAFELVRKIPMVADKDDGYAARRVDAEKALAETKLQIKGDQDQHAYDLLDATLETRSLVREDTKYGDLALQCTVETYEIFDPSKLTERHAEFRKSKICLRDYKHATEELLKDTKELLNKR